MIVQSFEIQFDEHGVFCVVLAVGLGTGGAERVLKEVSGWVLAPRTRWAVLPCKPATASCWLSQPLRRCLPWRSPSVVKAYCSSCKVDTYWHRGGHEQRFVSNVVSLAVLAAVTQSTRRGLRSWKDSGVKVRDTYVWYSHSMAC